MHTDRRGYTYETYRDGGRVCRRYIGRADWMGAAIYLQRLDRERDEEKRQRERAPIEAAKTLQTSIDAYCGALDSLVSDAMTAAGYHRHKRGNWRKRRAQFGEKPMPQTQNIAIPAPAGTAKATDRAQLAKAQKDPVAARELLDKCTPDKEAELLDILAPVARNASTHLISHLSADNELVKEAYRRQLEKTAREVAGPNPTPLEIQLANRVALCELSVVAAERLYSGCIGKSLHIWQIAGKQLDGAHRRHLSAIKTLASVRKAQLPDVQINVAEKQVNIGHVSGAASGHLMDE